MSRRTGAQSVVDMMSAGHSKTNPGQLFVFFVKIEGGKSALHLNVCRPIVAVYTVHPCLYDPYALQSFRYRAQMGIVAVQYHRLGVLCRRNIGSFHLLHGMIVVHMVHFHIQHHRHRGKEIQKCVLVFAGFVNKMLAAAQPICRMQFAKLRPAGHRGIFSGFQKKMRQHAGGGGFSVGTRNPDPHGVLLHQLS